MTAKKASTSKIIFRNIFRRIEGSVFLLKSLLSERHFIYFSCIVVAISCSFAVILLKSFAHNVFLLAQFINGYLKLPYFNSILPIIGILLTVFVVKNFLGGQIEKGSSRILFAVAKKGGIMPKKQMYSQIITSSLTVGLGGSAGLESPITITGAAFGSNFAQKYHLTQNERILLLACGVAAGIGAAFNAPIAGVLFAIEVVLTDVSISAFIPIIISAATGALVSTIVLSQDILLRFNQEQSFDYHNTPFYILLGILAGFTSVYHARNFQRIERFFNKLKNKTYKRAIFGASILAILIFFFPTLFGEGYESIKILSNDSSSILLENTLLERFKTNKWVVLLFLGLTVLLKSFATGLTIGSGGNGGNFAPSLFVGSYLGFLVAKTVNILNITSTLPISNFTVVGMAGILSGLFHAPLTAIFLIGEITGGYDLMVPLMIVSSISFAVSKQFEHHSMDVKHLADKGDVFTSDKDRNILLNLDLLKIVQTNFNSLSVKNNFENAVQIFATSEQKIIPVVDENNILLGLIDFDEVRPFLFNSYRVKFTLLKDVMSLPKNLISIEDGIEKVMKEFENSGKKIIPILYSGKFYGFVSKLDLLNCYRERLKEMVIE